jgi:hypothetical protein
VVARKLAAAYLDRLPRGEVVDLFSSLIEALRQAAELAPKRDSAASKV